MNFEIEADDAGIALQSAILIYGPTSRNRYVDVRQEERSFATLHPVSTSDGPGRPEIMDGRPLTEQDFAALINSLAPKDRPGVKWQDESILATGAGKMIWWTPPGKRAMFFSKSDRGADTFDGQGVCPVPAMVWMAISGSLYVFAVKGSARPTQETQLCQAPLFNVWACGQVCRGNVDFPLGVSGTEPKLWEGLLFGSRFSHPNFTEKNRLVKAPNHTLFWKKMVKKPTATFPEDVLVDIEFSVRDLLEADICTKLSKLTAEGEF